MKLTKMIYIASPYTFKGSVKQRNIIQEFRFNNVTKVAGQLQEIYEYAFILPITMSHITAKYMKNRNGEFKYWAKRDLTYISRCDEVWVITMNGWYQSIGVLAEIDYALANNIKVRYICPNSLQKTKTPHKRKEIVL